LTSLCLFTVNWNSDILFCCGNYTVNSSVSNERSCCYCRTVWFIADKGTFFPKWKEDTGRYVYQCSDRVKSWLKKVQMSGKKLFVLSSSYSDFACASLEHILGFVVYLVYNCRSSLLICNSFYGLLPGDLA